ncbi:MAG: phosphotransferase family protein [Chloroflexi bacterium]|nr:phosphotransferase family protein [Chloroflexota bacterium]
MIDTIPVRPDERFALERVTDFMCAAGVTGFDPARLEVEQFAAGHSNLTYLLRSGDWEAVLRRPPLGPVAPRAHDMAREFRMLERLHPSFALAPEPFVLCEDASVIGAPFYVMERRRGLVLDTDLPDGWTADPALHKAIAESVVRVLVKLHEVDWQSARLGEISHPAGYMQRQVSGWLERFARARTEDLPEVDLLSGWLVDRLPESPMPTVIHNDYKLNNLRLDATDPRRITAVLDWEMATVGDPLSDVASLLVYWTAPGEDELMGGLKSVTADPSFPTRQDVQEMYARLSGRDLANLDFYIAFAYFKLGVICQQIFYRWHNRQTHDERFSQHGLLAANLIRKAAQVARLV